ncbi:MAG: hypothetical protein ACI3V5_12180 [Faecousia sp.]
MTRNDTLIRRKFYQYLMPGILMVVAMQLGNVADGMFVGHALSYNAVSAISLSIPALYAMQENSDPMGGICLVKGMASQFKYLRTLNYNNTIIEINL